VKYLKKHGFFDAVPDSPEVKHLNLGMEEVRKELVGMKNKEGIKNYVCVIFGVHQFSIYLLVHSFGWDSIRLLEENKGNCGNMREAPKPKQFLTLLLILRGMQIGSQML
jgi:hypothetical protein